MFSKSRRCTASSSAIKMLAAIAFPGRYNYLSRIGALSPMPINTLLNVDGRPINVDVLPNLLHAAVAHVERHIDDDQKADVCDPAVVLQQARNEAGGEAHQCNRQRQAKYQDKRMVAGSTRDRQHVV